MTPNPPSFARLMDWLENRLPESEASHVAAQIAQADDATRAEVEWLRAFLRTSANTVLMAPPSGARQRVLQSFEAFARERRAPTVLQRLIARLAPPAGGPALGLAGSRSASVPVSRRQMLFYTDVADVIINIRPRGEDRRLDLSGQVLPTSAALGQKLVVQMVQNGFEYGITGTNELGEFDFEAVPPGIYEIVLSSNQYEIMIAPVELKT